MNEVNQNTSSGVYKGMIMGAGIPVLLVGALFTFEVATPNDISLVGKALEKMGIGTGRGEAAHIEETARTQAVQEWLLNWAKEQEVRQTIAKQGYEDAKKAAIGAAVQMEQISLSTQAEILKDSLGGQKTMVNVGDMACGVGLAFGIPEFAAGCHYAEAARDNMTKEVQTRLEGNRVRLIKDMLKSLPTPEEYGIEPVDIEEIMELLNDEKAKS